MSGWKFFIKFPAELFWRFWGFGYVCNLAIGDKCWLLDSEGYKPILRFVLTITESKYIRADFIQIIARKLFRFAAFYFHFRKHQETKESFLLGFYRDVDVFFICKQRVALAKLDHYQHRSWVWSQRYPLNRLHRIQNIYKYLLLLMSYRHENYSKGSLDAFIFVRHRKGNLSNNINTFPSRKVIRRQKNITFRHIVWFDSKFSKLLL